MSENVLASSLPHLLLPLSSARHIPGIQQRCDACPRPLYIQLCICYPCFGPFVPFLAPLGVVQISHITEREQCKQTRHVDMGRSEGFVYRITAWPFYAHDR